jgi:hypothetical protein
MNEYAEFRKQYEEQHPASVPRLEFEMSDYPRWVQWAVGVMFIAAALASGVHTVPTAYKTIESIYVAEWVRQISGISAFMFVELGILISAYILFKNWSLLVLVISIVCIGIAMVANLYSVTLALQTDVDNGAVFVAIFFGIGAPLVAALSGKVYVNVHRADRIVDVRARTKYKEDAVAWDSEIERAWKVYQKHQSRGQSDAGRTAARLSAVLSDRTDTGQTTRSPYGHNRTPDGQQRVIEYLNINPDHVKMSSRELAKLTGVGHDTANKGRNSWQLQQAVRVPDRTLMSANGHHE